MDDILFSIPEACGDPECPMQFHMAHYWYYPATDTYSVCDNDGNHEDVEFEDLPSSDHQDEAWRSYWQFVKRYGVDPCRQLISIPQTRCVSSVWQVRLSTWVGASKYGLRVLGARRNGRGDVVLANKFPVALLAYLDLNKKNCLNSFSTFESLAAAHIPVKRTAKMYRTIDVPIVEIFELADTTIRRNVRAAAAKALEEMDAKKKKRKRRKRA